MASKVKTATTTSSSSSTPYSGQEPWLNDLWSRANYVSNNWTPDLTQTQSDMGTAAGQYRDAASMFGDAAGAFRAAAPSYDTAANAYESAATSPLLNQATDYYTRVARGDFLSPTSNPYFQAMVDQSIAAARPSVDSAFASSGRLGSGSHAAAFSDAATRASTGLGYQNYATERGYQDNANQYLPTLAAIPAGFLEQAANVRGQGAGMYSTAAGLQSAAGDAYSSAGQRELAVATLPRELQYQNLQNYAGLIGSPIMSNTTSTNQQPYLQANPVMQGIGAATSLIGAVMGGGGGSQGWVTGASGLGGGGGGNFAATGMPYAYGTGGYTGQGPFLTGSSGSGSSGGLLSNLLGYFR